ncbi:peptidylprolyl isomerase [Allosphingosinicella deserti]|uniref:Peptidylprolyl isomerase n=1 Tax=Allosphingosinicella deserti TaxID=2116704 RepID=A0A2P7QUR6_9SPHN|nr:peptidylprolyl isomerase [Sphingomonas deserti]PSJ41701.1 peptidylprolyl isomerase [Sphingomonas deserti]
MHIAAAALLAASLLLAACANDPPDQAGSAPNATAAWRPRPVTGAPEPNDVIAKAPADAWRVVDPDALLIMEFKDGGRVAIELAPAFAPVHVANVKAFARSGWWNGSAIYRVQDNYVAQWGNGDAKTALPSGVVRQPAAEYDRPLSDLRVRALGYPDSYAPMVGHAESWPIGYDPAAGRAWLTHCYGMVGVGRDLAPDTGTGGELYAIIGHAPRHLDLNIAVIGRVVEGIELLSARPRGTEKLGFYKDAAQHVPIARVRLASDMPAAERPAYEVLRSDHDTFGQFVTGRANRGGGFFQRPAGGVDLCNVPVPVRKRA